MNSDLHLSHRGGSKPSLQRHDPLSSHPIAHWGLHPDSENDVHCIYENPHLEKDMFWCGHKCYSKLCISLFYNSWMQDPRKKNEYISIN